MNKGKIFIKKICFAIALCFVLMNVVAFFHAYKFTHFAEANLLKTKSPEKLNVFDKIKTLVFGVNNPRPINETIPEGYETIRLQSNKKIECWYFRKDSTKGTVVVLHGYSGKKSGMLDKATEFQKLNYNLLLVDFMGSGGSEGNQTTLGVKEAEEVKTVFDYLTQQGEQNIYLFGTSMGAVAIMKALNDYDLKAKGIILECPFGSMYQTTCARFKIMKAPVFPMAALLVFWGGLQNGFWAFGHNPTRYASQISCPTLLLYGEQDKNVSREEVNEIYKNLNAPKTLKTYRAAGHDNYLTNHKKDWVRDVRNFLTNN